MIKGGLVMSRESSLLHARPNPGSHDKLNKLIVLLAAKGRSIILVEIAIGKHFWRTSRGQ